MDAVPEKDKQVLALIDALHARLGADAFRVVDHWPDDPMAIGIASPKDPRHLSYISVTPGSEEPYFVSLEYPPEGEWADHAYLPGDERNECGMDELVVIISEHLRKAPNNASPDRTRSG